MAVRQICLHFRNFGFARFLRWIALAVLAGLAGIAASPIIAQQRAVPANEQRSSAGAHAANKLALVIGNGAYSSLTELANPTNDAKDICNALRLIGFKASCLNNVRTRRDFGEAIRLFLAEAKPGTETFFFYAGHGVQFQGENYLLPTEAQIWSEVDIDYEGVALSYLMHGLEQARSYPNVIVLDACRDNPFRQKKGVRVEAGLARVDPPVGTMLAYATAPNQAALDGQGRNGLFTKHLLARLSVPGLQLDEMFRQVANAVENEAWTSHRFKQVPYRSSSYSGSYCLAGCEDPKLADQMKDIEAQRNELTRKLEQVSRENERLKALAASGAEEVARLEQRIARLAEEEKTKGLQSVDVRHELERARSELAAAKAEQARRDNVERENQKRMMELERLRVELQKQSAEIDEYRKRIRELEAAGERNRGLEEAPQPSRDRPQKPAVIVPSF